MPNEASLLTCSFAVCFSAPQSNTTARCTALFSITDRTSFWKICFLGHPDQCSFQQSSRWLHPWSHRPSLLVNEVTNDFLPPLLMTYTTLPTAGLLVFPILTVTIHALVVMIMPRLLRLNTSGLQPWPTWLESKSTSVLCLEWVPTGWSEEEQKRKLRGKKRGWSRSWKFGGS